MCKITDLKGILSSDLDDGLIVFNWLWEGESKEKKMRCAGAS